jgi:hypothetical protein
MAQGAKEVFKEAFIVGVDTENLRSAKEAGNNAYHYLSETITLGVTCAETGIAAQDAQLKASDAAQDADTARELYFVITDSQRLPKEEDEKNGKTALALAAIRGDRYITVKPCKNIIARQLAGPVTVAPEPSDAAAAI